MLLKIIYLRFTVVMFPLMLLRKYMSKKLELMISLIARSNCRNSKSPHKLVVHNYYGKREGDTTSTFGYRK